MPHTARTARWLLSAAVLLAVALLLRENAGRREEAAKTPPDGMAAVRKPDASSASFASETSSATPSQPIRRVSAVGIVRDPDGAALPGATVCIRRNDGVGTETCVTSDARGTFAFHDLTIPPLRIRAALPGYFQEPETGHLRPPQTKGDDAGRRYVIVLVPGAEISGVVEDLLGGPIAEAVVQGSGENNDHARTQTDAQGHFRMWLTKDRNLMVTATRTATHRDASRRPRRRHASGSCWYRNRR